MALDDTVGEIEGDAPLVDAPDDSTPARAVVSGNASLVYEDCTKPAAPTLVLLGRNRTEKAADQASDRRRARDRPASRSERRAVAAWYDRAVSPLAFLRRRWRLGVLAAAALGAALTQPAGASDRVTTPAVVPVHATVLTTLPNGTAIVGFDEVTAMLPASARRVALDGAGALPNGTQIDALLDRAASPWRLTAIHRAEREVAGTVDPAATHLLGVGDAIPDVPLVDQRGRIVRLDRLAGKVTLLSFVYTRCPRGDLCPLITAKYAALQRRLDAKRFRLAEVTLDPRFDSPDVMLRYGAQYGADARGWSLLTGEPMQVKELEDRFGVTSLEDGPGHYNHDDQLVVIGRDGRIARIVPTGSWSPDEIVATANAAAGTSSNPFQRFVLDAFGSFVAYCGGSVSTGLAMLEAGAILAGFVVFGTVLVLFGRRIWRRESEAATPEPKAR